MTVTEGYWEGLSDSAQTDYTGGITSAGAQIFSNFVKRRSTFHFDLGAYYRRYSNGGRHDAAYNANAGYSFNISERTLLKIDNRSVFAPKDSDIFFSFNSSNEINSVPYQVILDSRKIFQNYSTISLTNNLSNRASLGFSGTYGFHNYPQESSSNTHSLLVEVSFNWQLTRWLQTSNSFSTSFFGEGLNESRIHRIQVGGLRYRLGLSWTFQANGGVGFSNYYGTRVGEEVHASIGYNSSNTAFSWEYGRMFTYTEGISGLMKSDEAKMNWTRNITPRVRSNLMSSLSRGSNVSNDGIINTFLGGVGLEIIINRYLQMTANSYYQDQKSMRSVTNDLNRRHLTAIFGLNIYLAKDVTKTIRRR